MFVKLEIKKILHFRLFWIIIVVFLSFNTFLIVTNYDSIGDGVETINNYVHSGIKLDDEYNYCDNFDYSKENAVYDYYNDLSAQKLLKISDYFSGTKKSKAFNKIVEKNYKKVDERIKQIKSDGEAQDVYYVGTIFGLHNELYGTVLYIVMIECFVIAILMTAYLMNYENMFDTYQNVYSSKRGRQILFSKSLAAIGAVILASIILITATLMIFFYKVPQLWSFMQSSVSSAMATEDRMIIYPFITWIKMSQLQYLLAVVALMIVYVILASLITFALYFVSKNTFMNIAFTIILYFIFLAIWFGFINSTVLSFIQVFNPSIAMYNLKGWFMEYALNPMLSYQGYEIAVAFTYIILTMLIIILMWHWFKKKDIS